MLRDDTAERPGTGQRPMISAENRSTFVISSVVALVLLAATAVVLAVQGVGDADDARAAHGYRGEIENKVMFRRVVFDPEGTWLYAATGTTVEVRHRVTHRRDGAVFEAGSRVNAIALSPDGRRLVTASDDNAVRIFDTESRRLVGSPLTADGLQRVVSVAISPDSTLMAAAGDGGTAIWNLGGGDFVGMLRSATGAHSVVAFSPDGSTIATGDGGGGTIALWHTATREADGEPLTGQSPGAPVNSLAFDRGGALLAAGSADNSAFVWNLSSRDHTEFHKHDQPVHTVVLTKDGRTLITVSLNSVRIWDVGSGAEISTIIDKDGSDDINDVALSPDGDTLAVIRDHRIQLWSLSTAMLR
jgi:WD40 repeat protein